MFGRFIKSSSPPPKEEGPAAVLPLGALPLSPVSELVNQQKGMAQRIQVASGITEDRFKQIYLPYIERLAALVQTLPATRALHHTREGGLFEFCVECGFYALQAANGHVLAGHAPNGLRRQLEPKWRFAVFVAAASQSLGRLGSAIRVVSENGDHWNPYLEDLVDWAKERKCRYYYVQWGKENREFYPGAPLFVNRLLSPEAMSYLTEPEPEILEHVLKTLGRQLEPNDYHTIAELVRRAYRAAVDINQKSAGGHIPLTTHTLAIERQLLDALRQLNKQRWKGSLASPVVVTKKGVYILWDQAADEVRTWLERRDVPGVPSDPDTLASIMIEHDYAMPSPSGATWIWRIKASSEEAGPGERAIRLMHPELLYADQSEIPTARACSIEGENDDEEPGDIDAQPEDAKEHEPVTSPGENEGKHDRTPAPAADFLAEAEAGEVLRNILQKQAKLHALGEGKLTVFWSSRGLMMQHPQSFDGATNNISETLAAWQGNGWLLEDPTNPTRRVWREKSKGKAEHYVIIKTEIGKRVETSLGMALPRGND